MNEHVGAVYYTDNELNPRILTLCQSQLAKCFVGDLVSVSLRPISFGRNITLPLERGYLTMFKQILAGLEASMSDIVFFCEHDVLYHPSHFAFRPARRGIVYYNTNFWRVRWSDGHALKVGNAKVTSALCGFRETLIEHYRKRIAIVVQNGYSRRIGFEPGTHQRPERIDDLRSDGWQSEYPNIDIRHAQNLTSSRWHKKQFRNQRFTTGWTESRVESIPGWEIYNWNGPMLESDVANASGIRERA